MEDDAAINKVVCSYLGKLGAECVPAFSGTEGLMHLEGERRFDLLITDLMLPGAPGEEVVAAARARHVPIIVLSARATVADRVDLLRLGADDYLVKPFDLEELAARCEVVLRRVGGGGASGAGGDGGDADFGNRTSVSASDGAAGPPAASRASGGIACGTGSDAVSQSPDECLRFGSWMLDEGARAFTVAGEPVRLTRTEFDILHALMAAPRRVHTKRALSEAAGGDAAALEDKTVSTHIGNLRAKLRPTGTDRYIETVWGVGFKLRDVI
ncbi:response regulator transcription factor [Adlercreutzia equolifaciens]|nr:response regulator transcription factor [Adlercreutzia equolifaciens]